MTENFLLKEVEPQISQMPNPEEMKRADIVRVFIVEPLTCLDYSEDPLRVQFLQVDLAYKIGQENYGQVMPIGGKYNAEEESVITGLTREAIQESHVRPFDLEQIADLDYVFCHTVEGWRSNSTVIFIGYVVGGESMTVSDVEEDKMELVTLNVLQLRELFEEKTLQILYPSGKVQQLEIVDHLNTDEQERKQRNVYAKQEKVEYVKSALFYHLNLKEAEFKKRIMMCLIDVILADDRLTIEDRRIRFEKIQRLGTPQQIEDEYQQFVKDYSITIPVLQQALDYVNLDQKLSLLNNNEQETILHADRILRDVQKMTREQLNLLYTNPTLAQLLTAYNLLIEYLLQRLNKEIEGNADLSIKKLLSNPSLTDKEFRSIIASFGLHEENLPQDFDLVSEFLIDVIKSGFFQKMGKEHCASFSQINTVAYTNQILPLMRLMASVIPNQENKSPEENNQIVFEAVRKAKLLPFADNTVSYLRDLASLPNHRIEYELIAPMYKKRFGKEIVYIWDSEDKNTFIDVFYINDPRIDEYIKKGCYKEVCEEKLRIIQIKGQDKVAFIDPRPPKSAVSIMRKSMIQGIPVQSIRDRFGRYIAFEDTSARIERELTTYRFDRLTGKLDEFRGRFYDYQLVFDFIDELKAIGGNKIKIVDLTETPLPRQRYKSRGPGGGARIPWNKFYLYLENEDLDTKDKYPYLIEEMMIFVSQGDQLGFKFYIQKSIDDQRRNVDRIFEPDKEKTWKMPLSSILYPFQIYPVITDAYKKNNDKH